MEKSITENRFLKAQNSLVVQQSDFSLLTISQMVESKAIDIKPHYQRRERWNIDKQSALIESFLLNVPVPPVYLSEDDYGTYSVIDGKQRISAICDFMSGKLALTNLKEFSELNGTKFERLSTQLSNALKVRPYIRVITLLKQSDPSLKYEVFLRLNTGGERLSAQEIRNVAYSGKFNEMLYELSKNEFLRDRLKIENDKSNAFRSMEDLEHILRYFTIRSKWKSIKKTLMLEMDEFMKENREAKTVEFKKSFNRSISACQNIWGIHAFQKPIKNGWRDQIISPLFDAEMVAVSLMTDKEIEILISKRTKVISKTNSIFKYDEDFVKSVSQSTNNASATKKRVERMHQLLKSVADE